MTDKDPWDEWDRRMAADRRRERVAIVNIVLLMGATFLMVAGAVWLVMR